MKSIKNFLVLHVGIFGAGVALTRVEKLEQHQHSDNCWRKSYSVKKISLCTNFGSGKVISLRSGITV